MNRAPGISEQQARVLRLAYDAGHVKRNDCNLRTLETCCEHGWLAQRWLEGRISCHVLTEYGRAALVYYQAHEEQGR